MEQVSKSQMIRDLYMGGMTRAEIAKKLGLRYQHVRNVLVQMEQKSQKELKKSQLELGL